MRINTNVAALNSYNQLKNTQNNLSQSLERLSSGKRINSAADDAAGLAISEKMNAQVNGLGQAQRNAQDGISMIQTAEGALKESHSILQRMRELSVQAANDTNTQADREEIQKEVNQLTSELDRISTDTEFNTQKLLNGNKAAKAEMLGSGTNITGSELTNESLESGTYSVSVDSVTTTDVASGSFSSGGTGMSVSGAITSSGNSADAGNYEIEVSDVKTSGSSKIADFTLRDSNGNELASKASGVVSGTVTDISLGDYTLQSSGASGVANAGSISFETDINASLTVNDSNGDEVGSVTSGSATDASASGVSSEISVDGFGNFEVGTDLVSGASDDIDVTNNGATLQIGANEDQNTVAAMNNMSSEALEVNNVDLTTQSGANSAIATIDDAIEQVSAERSKLGAVQNRLEHTINNLNTSQENLTAAESRISDVDMAKEMMNMSKQQILSQAGTAMMAQANQMPQGVLQLLG